MKLRKPFLLIMFLSNCLLYSQQYINFFKGYSGTCDLICKSEEFSDVPSLKDGFCNGSVVINKGYVEYKRKGLDKNRVLYKVIETADSCELWFISVVKVDSENLISNNQNVFQYKYPDILKAKFYLNQNWNTISVELQKEVEFWPAIAVRDMVGEYSEWNIDKTVTIKKGQEIMICGTSEYEISGEKMSYFLVKIDEIECHIQSGNARLYFPDELGFQTKNDVLHYVNSNHIFTNCKPGQYLKLNEEIPLRNKPSFEDDVFERIPEGEYVLVLDVDKDDAFGTEEANWLWLLPQKKNEKGIWVNSGKSGYYFGNGFEVMKN